jgi:NADPH:quinone reductase-like Zn-dependent oxidoreductase
MAKAVQFDSYGGVDVLEVRDVPRPVPGVGEVLVEVKAAGINISEAAIRAGAVHEMFPATFPSGQGSELAGVVAKIGAGVGGFAMGDEVIGFSMRRSSHAEYVTVPADQLTDRPSAVSREVAGSLFVAGATAYAAVRAVRLAPGDTAVIAGAAGGADAATAAVVAELADLVARGELEVPIAGVFALDNVRKAYHELEKRRTRGKLVLRP